ncbi:hypothetical protein Bbelb_336270 [Branchiostoma belcheri]|nr:hypothetical protein Bbelb_336270 [Branchiostoma belcheri]
MSATAKSKEEAFSGAGKKTEWAKEGMISFRGPNNATGRMFVSRASNEIFLLVGYNHLINVLNMQGVFLREFSTEREKFLNLPQDLSMDRNGSLWVLMLRVAKRQRSYIVQQFSKYGEAFANYKFELPLGNSREYYSGIAVHTVTDNIVAIKAFVPSRALCVYRTNGSLVRTSEGMLIPSSVAVGQEGDIFVVGNGIGRVFIYKYDMRGRYLTRFESLAFLRLGQPRDICTDSLGHIIVAGFKTNQVVMLNENGTYIRTIADTTCPHQVSIGREEQLVVVSNCKTIYCVKECTRGYIFPK